MGRVGTTMRGWPLASIVVLAFQAVVMAVPTQSVRALDPVHALQDAFDAAPDQDSDRASGSVNFNNTGERVVWGLPGLPLQGSLVRTAECFGQAPMGATFD